ncbi:MAG: hypothetical protein ACI32H_05310 [Bacilli bacterium]
MNTELAIVMRDFCEHALISLSKDYHNYFVYTKGSKSKISKYFNFYDLERIIEELIYKLFLNGNVKLYFYLEKNKLYLSEKKNDTGNIILVKNFKWNLSFLSENNRKKIVKRLKKLDSLNFKQDYTDKNYSRNYLYVNELVNNEVLKSTKDFLYLSINERNYTDIYYVYSLIRMRKKQLLMVNYVVNLFNDSVKEALKIDDVDDNLVFNGLTMNTLNELENKLLSGSDTLKNITDCLFNRINNEI